MKKKSKRTPKEKMSSKALAKAMAIPGSAFDTSDEPEFSVGQFARDAVPLAKIIDDPKVPLSIRVEKSVVDWFKRGGPGYQKRIRQALRKVASGER